MDKRWMYHAIHAFKINRKIKENSVALQVNYTDGVTTTWRNLVQTFAYGGV
jgi:hypothetical protein